MNRRGWLRIVEASIAILIILTVLFALYKRQEANNEPDLSERARNILEEVAKDSSLRDDILRNESSQLEKVVAKYVPESTLTFEIRICELDEVCGKSTFTNGNVYSAERVISASINNEEFSPKKLRLFIWRK